MSLSQKVAKELQKLMQSRTDAPQDGPDLRWARRIIDRHERGERVKSATLQMARDALRGVPK